MRSKGPKDKSREDITLRQARKIREATARDSLLMSVEVKVQLCNCSFTQLSNSGKECRNQLHQWLADKAVQGEICYRCRNCIGCH